MSKRETDIAQLDTALSKLAEADRTTIKDGAKLLHRRARDNWTIWKKEWFSKDKTIKTLLAALHSAEESTTIELIGALGNASQRYDILDSRIHDALVNMFPQAPDRVQLAIAQAVPHFGTSTAWNLILQALDAKPASTAHHTVALAVARYGKSIGPSMRPKFTKSLLEVTDFEKKPDALDTIAMAVAVVGSPDDVPFLRRWLEKAKNKFNRDSILRAIDACMNSQQAQSPSGTAISDK